MNTYKEKALQEATKVVGFIQATELTQDQKETIQREAVDNVNQHINPGWLLYRKSVSNNIACVEWTDNDENYIDLDGNEYIDCLGGFGIFTCGHRNPEIVKTVKAQLDKNALHGQELLDPLRGYLAKLVAMITPGDLQYCFFTNGGAEAVEMALKLARMATGGNWFISTVGAFHGKSFGALSVGGKSTYREAYLPMVQQVLHVKYGDSDALETAIANLEAVGETVAGVIVEPIQGEAGVQIPPEGYLKRVRAICDDHHIAMIADEIQTGMGRTGAMWRCETEDVVPDIMTYGKAFGGGIMPITGIIARPWTWVDKLQENPWLLGSPTFGGNPLACSAAIATIQFMLEHDVPKMAAEKGLYFLERLHKLKDVYPTVLTDVRGVGLLIGLEFAHAEVGYRVVKGLFERRVITAGTLVNAKTVRIEPPATIRYETVDLILQRLEEAILVAKEEFHL